MLFLEGLSASWLDPPLGRYRNTGVGGVNRLVYIYKWHKHTIFIRCQQEGLSINRRRQNLVIMCSLPYHKCKGKVKWSRYRPGVVQRVGRGIALLFHDRGTRREWVYHKCTGQNCNIKLRESVQAMEIRDSECDDYEHFVRGRVPEVQDSNMWERE